MIRIIKILSFLLFLFFGKFSFAQVKITCNIYPSEIKINELSSIQFTVENFSDLRFFTPPDFKDVQVVSGPIFGGESYSINGKQRKRASIGFIVKAKKPGVFKFENASCEVDGAVVKCKAVVLRVKKNVNNSQLKIENEPKTEPGILEDQYIREGENIDKKIAESMHLRLSVSKKSCYVGEPIVATYKLYTRLKSDCNLIQNPSFNGFSVIDLQAPDVTEKYFEELNGQKYSVYVIRKSQLYPLLEGNIEIEPASVEGNVEFIKNTGKRNSGYSSFLDDPFFSETVNSKLYLKTDSAIVNVKPLPPGKPESFNGAVGNFEIQSKLEDDVFTANKGGKLIITIKGSGNFQMINSPEISWPKGFDTFEPEIKDDVNKISVPVTGKKKFEFEFNTNSVGDFSIPPVNFSFFDPELKEYKTLSTAPINFKVLPADKKSKSKEHFAMTPGSNQQDSENPFYKNKILIASGGAALLGLLLFLGFTRRNKKDSIVIPVKENDTKEWTKIIESRNYNPLQESEECIKMEDCSKFYFTLNNEFKTFLSSKFCGESNKLSTEFVKDCMDKNNICNATMLSVEQLLHEIEWRSYTPFVRDEQMEAILVRAKEMVQLINSYDSKGAV